MRYPFPGTTKAERKILDQIGSGNYSLAGIFSRNLRTYINRFLAEGWINQCGDRQIGVDKFGKVTIPEYEMEISWHMVWCKYQSEQYDKTDSNDEAGK
jgi:hypothetical protein